MEEKTYEVTFSVTLFVGATNEEQAKYIAEEAFGWNIHEYGWNIDVKESPEEKTE